MFKLIICKILFTKWAHFKFDACYKIVSKIVGMGARLPWCSISSSFQNSLKTSGHRGYEFLEFWCWNLVPFLPDIGFQLLKSSWSSLTYISYNDVPNVLYRWKIWTAGRPIQHLDSSTTKPCCCNSCSMWFCIVRWNTQGLTWNRRHLEGSICCSKTFIYLSAFIVPSKTCKLPIPCALMHPHTIRDAGFWTERWWHAGRSPSSLARRTRHPWFPTKMSNLDSSDHRTLFHFETVNFKWALVHRTRRCFWTMFTYDFHFAW